MRTGTQPTAAILSATRSVPRTRTTTTAFFPLSRPLLPQRSSPLPVPSPPPPLLPPRLLFLCDTPDPLPAVRPLLSSPPARPPARRQPLEPLGPVRVWPCSNWQFHREDQAAARFEPRGPPRCHGAAQHAARPSFRPRSSRTLPAAVRCPGLLGRAPRTDEPAFAPGPQVPRRLPRLHVGRRAARSEPPGLSRERRRQAQARRQCEKGGRHWQRWPSHWPGRRVRLLRFASPRSPPPPPNPASTDA